MKNWIQNYDNLATDIYHKQALDLVNCAYDSIDTKTVIENNLVIKDGKLLIRSLSFSLAEYKNIYVVGFGKVVCQAALTIEKVLGEYVKRGAVVGIKEKICQKIKTFEGTHPRPSVVNFKATQEIEEISKSATKDDLVIVIVGGGGSALLCSSMDECEQGQRLYDDFLSSGGSIDELNVVRKHISTLKGGGLAEKLYPATVLGLIFSDIPGDDCRLVASGPTYLDTTTIDDARAIVNKYNLDSFNLVETPKEEKYFEKVHNVLLVSNHQAIDSMTSKASEFGFQTINLGCDIFEFPDKVSSMFLEKIKSNTVIVAGGETKLVIPGGCIGKGGRNDFLSLVMSNKLSEKQIFSSFASDGKDNTEASGALVDSMTKDKIMSLGINLDEHTRCCDSFPVLEKTNNLIFTGMIEANVSDLMFLMQHE
jgi:glycerate-2-kinase